MLTQERRECCCGIFQVENVQSKFDSHTASAQLQAVAQQVGIGDDDDDENDDG